MTESENPEAPSLIAVGAQALVDNASRLGITNQVRMGTIVSTDPVTAILDGDSAPVTVIRTSGAGWLSGSRIYALETKGAFFILGQTTPLEAATKVLITPVANTPTSADVQWGFTFPEIPAVTTTPETSVIGSTVLGTSVTAITVTGCKVWVYRTNTTPTTVHVHAIQRTSVT